MIYRARAPLRLGLAGGGSDLSPFCDQYGGYILNATINLYAFAHLEERCDGRVRFVAVDRDEVYEADCDSLLDPPNWLTLHAGVYRRIVKDFLGNRPPAITLTTFSDVPGGSGLGASSTLVVAMIEVFKEWQHLPLGEYEVARLAYEVERIDVGCPGGKQDQYAAAFGGFNFIEFYADERVIVNPLRVRPNIVKELEASLLMCYTEVARDSSAVILEQRANLSAGNAESLAATHDLKREAVAMKEALLKGDLAGFAESLGRGWETKKRTSEMVSNPKLEEVYSIAMRSGATAGKVSGAGGGGFMLFFADPIVRPKVMRALREAGLNVYTVHFQEEGAVGWPQR